MTEGRPGGRSPGLSRKLEGTWGSGHRSNRIFIPVFRYLRAAGITSEEMLADSKYEGAKKVVGKLREADYTLPSYAARYRKEFAKLSTQEIIEKAATKSEAVLMLVFQPADVVDLEVLAKFLRENSEDFDELGEPYRTGYRKLVCRYDKLAFGF